MITLNKDVTTEIRMELESIPEKYHKPLNSTHEGYAVLLEEVDELWDEIKNGEKKAHQEYSLIDHIAHPLPPDEAHKLHLYRMRKEAVQVAAMAIRFIQDLT